jgi:hypothetical protein
MNLIKISDNEFRIDGDIEFWRTIRKTVVVDGVEYENVVREPYMKSLSESFNNKDKERNWFKWAIDYSQFGYDIVYVWDYIHSYSVGLLKDICIHGSQNSFAALHCSIIHLGIIDNSIIKEIKTGDSALYLRENYTNLYKNTSNVEFVANYYGSGLGIHILIPYYKFIKLDFTKFSDDIKRQLEKYVYEYPKLFNKNMLKRNLTVSERLECSLELINHKINKHERTS